MRKQGLSNAGMDGPCQLLSVWDGALSETASNQKRFLAFCILHKVAKNM